MLQLAGTVNKPESEVQNEDEDESVDMTTPDITIAHLSSVAGQWTTKNTQSVGELWIGLLRSGSLTCCMKLLLLCYVYLELIV